MTDYSEKARAYFLEGYNCAQSVFLAFHDELGLDQAAAARIASSFGGGMGRLREVCGAVSGMFLVLGMRCGYSDPSDDAGKKLQYEQVQLLAQRFKEQHGSILCRDLLGLDHASDEPTPSARTTDYYKERPCAGCIADAAGLLAELLKTRA